MKSIGAESWNPTNTVVQMCVHNTTTLIYAVNLPLSPFTIYLGKISDAILLLHHKTITKSLQLQFKYKTK